MTLTVQEKYLSISFTGALSVMQALGPVALVSLLLNDGLTKAIPGSDVNSNPNLPDDPELQDKFNRAAVQGDAVHQNGRAMAAEFDQVQHVLPFHRLNTLSCG